MSTRSPRAPLLSLALVLSVAFVFMIAGCGDDGDKSPALSGPPSAILRFDNQSGAATSPSMFRVKLLAAQLVSDSGSGATLYLNPGCQGDLVHCDISSGTAEDGTPFTHIVTDFLDLEQSSDTVNAALGAEAATIAEGTYNRVDLQICSANSGSQPELEWANSSPQVQPQQFDLGRCTIQSVDFSSPLVVGEGDHVTVTLSYNYANAVSTGASANGDNCINPGTSFGVCFTTPTFTPVATK